MMELFTMIAFFHSKGVTNLSLCQILKYCMTVAHGIQSWYFRFIYIYGILFIFSSTFRRKKVELLSSLQRLGRLSFLSESISQKLSKVSIWNMENLFTIKRGTNYNKADAPLICISRVICPCFDIVHRN